MRTAVCIAVVTFSICLSSAARQVDAQQIGKRPIILEALTITGTIESVSPGILVVKDASGQSRTIRIAAKGKQGVTLSNGVLVSFPAQVSITGSFGLDSIRAGQRVRFKGQVNRSGRTQGEIKEIRLVTGKEKPTGIKVEKAAKRSSDYSTCAIACQITRFSRGRLQVRISADNGFTRKTVLSFKVAKDAKVRFKSDDIRHAGAGAKVSRLVAVRFDTGDIVAKTLEVVVTSNTKSAASVDDKLLAKYRKLSDEQKAPRLIRSQHFAFMTDISDRQAGILLDKLETMVGLLTKYFGRAPKGVVEGFIVHDLSRWPKGLLIEPRGVAKIRERAGICFLSRLGKTRRAVLYSCDDHGVVQHECTHGFCHLALGSTGPTWLAEGVAEMGQYWKQNQKAVDIDRSVMSYLRQSKPKRKLREIAIPGRIEAGTWREYAWRWALCHLLANNPNYAPRFKALAIALMERRNGVSFATVYGPVASQLSFEYDQFLKTLDNGYRADLCAWDWITKPTPIRGKRRTQKKIKAAYGWQASGVQLEQGVSYDVAAIGKWKLAKNGREYDADGDPGGRGQLVGVVFNDFKLSDPIPLGKLKTFVAPADGQLFLRCQDDWNKLADNEGELTVHFRKSHSR